MEHGSTTSESKPLSEHAAEPSNDISKQYEIPAPSGYSTFSALKDRIRHHYELCSDFYYSLWGEHIHHGYFKAPADTKEVAQIQLIDLLLDISKLKYGSTILDVGCGIGGTTRYLAKNHGCSVTGLTISGRQVEMSKKLTLEEVGAGHEAIDSDGFIRFGDGRVCYIELDAEKMKEHFLDGSSQPAFDCVWISEALSHFPEKSLFFQNAMALLRLGGKLVIADWFKAEELTNAQMEEDIKPIEDGMLLPPLCTQTEYVNFARQAGLSVLAEPLDISKEVAKTWDISWSLIQSPSLWAFAFSQGRDGIAFLQAFRAMRRGYANGTFRYAIMAFQK